MTFVNSNYIRFNSDCVVSESNAHLYRARGAQIDFADWVFHEWMHCIVPSDADCYCLITELFKILKRQLLIGGIRSPQSKSSMRAEEEKKIW